MRRIRPTNLRRLIVAAFLAIVAGNSSVAQKNAFEPQTHATSIGHGITLH